MERSGKEWKGIEIKGKRSKEMERNSKKVQRTWKHKGMQPILFSPSVLQINKREWKGKSREESR